MFRLINIVAIALFIIMTIILMKYKLVCEITIDGEKVGYITDKEQFEQSVDRIINKEEECKVSTVAAMPEFKLTLIDKTEKTNEETILAKVQESAQTTYKLYVVTIDGKEKAILDNIEEAEKLIAELNEKYNKKLNITTGIIEKYTTSKTKTTVAKTAKSNIVKELDKKVNASTSKVTKTTIASTTKASAQKSTSVQKTTKVASLNGVKLSVTPVSGIITSRFGSRESIRSSGHTGIDIAAPKGTAIKAACSGTVTFAGYSGGYGYLVKVSHGNGITTYYGHCSKLYVSKGENVTAGQKIAAVGSTGNSTGNHLHFEVVKNGVELNPQNYLYKGK